MTVVALGQVASGPNREDNIEAALRLIAEAAGKGASLICFPEMGFDRFFPQHRADPAFFDLAEPIPRADCHPASGSGQGARDRHRCQHLRACGAGRILRLFAGY